MNGAPLLGGREVAEHLTLLLGRAITMLEGDKGTMLYDPGSKTLTIAAHQGFGDRGRGRAGGRGVRAAVSVPVRRGADELRGVISVHSLRSRARWDTDRLQPILSSASALLFRLKAGR